MTHYCTTDRKIYISLVQVIFFRTGFIYLDRYIREKENSHFRQQKEKKITSIFFKLSKKTKEKFLKTVQVQQT